MRIHRNCKNCGVPIVAIKETQYFCSRKCFKKDYWKRNKEARIAAGKHPRFPVRACAYCTLESQLPFDPMKSPKKYGSWRCPYCGLSNTLANQYIENPRSSQIITQILAATIRNVGSPTGVVIVGHQTSLQVLSTSQLR